VITEGHLARHYQGRHGGRDPALLDIVQDYALKLLCDRGVFDLGVTFKGGTALRKYRAGNLGRFSTDLDFAAADEIVADIVLEALNGAELYDVQFTVEVVTPHRRGQITANTPLGTPAIEAARIDSLRSPWLPAEDIGLLSGEPDTEGWLQRFQDRFGFLTRPTFEEKKLARCDPRDRYAVQPKSHQAACQFTDQRMTPPHLTRSRLGGAPNVGI